MTAYELRNFIKNNFKSMYSDSLGSIQAALKKLFELEMVTFEELVEKGVNKKRYSITETGREALIEWIKIPINTSKTKNYDFGKLFFMGYVSKKDQKTLIDKIILSLEEEYEALDFGIEEYWDSGAWCFVEWAERIPSLLPSSYTEVQLSVIDATTRSLTVVQHN